MKLKVIESNCSFEKKKKKKKKKKMRGFHSTYTSRVFQMNAGFTSSPFTERTADPDPKSASVAQKKRGPGP